MSRPLRIMYPGAVYHVTSRGNARAKIFQDDQDRENFLSVLAAVVKRYNWLCHAYCLMDNHYHLLIETPDANLSVGMRQLNGAFTQRCNQRHKRCGHIFQGRFKAIVVDKDNYLLELCRYVVLNPVRAGMVEKAEQWPWSSYLASAGSKSVPSCLSVEWVISLFGPKVNVAQARYRKFVQEVAHPVSPWEALQGQVILGGEGFVEKFKDLIADKQQLREVSRQQPYVGRPTLEKLFQMNDSKTTRDRCIYEAHVKYGYTLKEIGDHLKIHYSTVSKVISRAAKE
jgi:putative transposase